MRAMESKPHGVPLHQPRTPGLERNYPANCWWVAAAISEVSTKPISRWLLDQRVVIFRTASGAVAALEDRCAHRFAPLSAGKVIGENIACPYHGMRFDVRGACTLVPTQSNVPAALQVHSYPVREHGSFVWIWMGEPDKARFAPLPEVPWFTDPAFFQMRRYTEVRCNYMLLHENLMDLTHIPHLHADGVEYDGWDRLPEDIRVTDREVRFSLSFFEEPVAPFQAKAMGIEATRKINRTDWGIFASPACTYVGSDMQDPAPAPGMRERYSFRVMHCLTPISPSRCHYWVAHAQDYGHDVPDLDRDLNQLAAVVIKQDTDIVEAIQTTIEAGSRSDVGEVLVRSDRAASEARRIVNRMVDAERRDG